MEQVILVDEKDKEIGLEEKIKAHKEGKLHRAFSVFVFNQKGEMLLQRRALTKYHSGGLWTNTCCSHPRKGEDVDKAASRRLKEEMGFSCGLKEVFSFIYKTGFDNGLMEHEFDHVFVGAYESEPKINPEEVAEYKWVTMEDLLKDVKKNPQNYTFWFKEILKKVGTKLSAR
ncbi:MAG TPA: isopentenyl-diphosphate Delta-isomerase [archaeon]|nr:isopentenyl-diphosphate Delta-isomerase [archaeon]